MINVRLKSISLKLAKYIFTSVELDLENFPRWNYLFNFVKIEGVL